MSFDETPSHPFLIPDFRRLLVANSCAMLARSGLAVVLGYQIYKITADPGSIGVLGLVEAIPALSLALLGGYIADRFERRAILLVMLPLPLLSTALFAWQQFHQPGTTPLWSLYLLAFIAGTATGVASPAMTALEAQIVPIPLAVKASSWFVAGWLTSSIAGPLIATQIIARGGIMLARWLVHLGVSHEYTQVIATSEITLTYAWFAGLFALAWLCMLRVGHYPQPAPCHEESIIASITQGVAFVARNQIFAASMALDLFAVLFGGAIAMLPVFADEVLFVGPEQLGQLNAAPQAGALLTMLWATRHPPLRNTGRTLFYAVAGFGVCMIVFAFSTNFYLSMLALFLSGVCDGLSMVIRRSILRLLSPTELRGRIAAVNMMFIGASNELGAFESGLAAKWLGTQRSVWLGGCVTLLVVAGAAVLAPRLRRLSLDEASSESMPE